MPGLRALDDNTVSVGVGAFTFVRVTLDSHGEGVVPLATVVFPVDMDPVGRILAYVYRTGGRGLVWFDAETGTLVHMGSPDGLHDMTIVD